MKSLLVKIRERNTDTLWSWVVCLSSFLIQLLVVGVQNSFGTIFVALLDKFGRSESETVWVGATAVGLTYFCGPLSTYLCNRFGCRVVACTGSVLLAISGFLTAFAGSISLMYFTFGVLNGVASSMLFFSSLVALIEYFYKYLPTASGVSVSGSGVGTVVITLLLQHLISRYGLKIAFQTLAGMSAICFIASLAYAPLTSSKDSSLKESLSKFPEDYVERVDADNGEKKRQGQCLRLFKLGKHWKNKGFVVWTMAMALIMFVCYIPIMYLVLIAEEVGVPPAKGALLISIFAICSTLGKIIIGKVANLKCANRLRIAQFALLMMTVSTCLLPLAKSYKALVAYSAVQGFFDGSFSVLIGLITNDVVGKELMAGAVASVYFIVSVPMTIGPPIAGLLYGHLGDYNAVFFLSGSLLCTGMLILFLVPWLTPPTLPKPNFKHEPASVKSSGMFSRFVNGNRYDLSCVDEQNLADMYEESVAQHLIKRNRSLIDGSSSDSRRSSFILFTIVSEENQRDISAYSSHQDLAANTDIVTSISNSVRSLFHGSHSSLFSLNHSHVIEAPNLEPIPEVACDTRDSETCVLIHRDGVLETVPEEKEIGKNFGEEEVQKTPMSDNNSLENCSVDYEESGTKEIDMPDNTSLEGIAEEGFAVNLGISESDLSYNSNKSSSQWSTGTADSGFDEWKGDLLCTCSNSASSTSLVEKPTLSKDIPLWSCSCTGMSALSKANQTNDVLMNKGAMKSQDLSDRLQSDIDIDSYEYNNASFDTEKRYDRMDKQGVDLIDSCQSEDYYNDVIINLYPEVQNSEVVDEGCEDLDTQKNIG